LSWCAVPSDKRVNGSRRSTQQNPQPVEVWNEEAKGGSLRAGIWICSVRLAKSVSWLPCLGHWNINTVLDRGEEHEEDLLPQLEKRNQLQGAPKLPLSNVWASIWSLLWLFSEIASTCPDSCHFTSWARELVIHVQVTRRLVDASGAHHLFCYIISCVEWCIYTQAASPPKSLFHINPMRMPFGLPVSNSRNESADLWNPHAGER